MNNHELLYLAALLHDIGKFRQRATDRYTKHQIHSYAFVNEDFGDFFAPCGDTFKNAIRNHHTKGNNLTEKQVILADHLSAAEREDEERETEDFVQSPLVAILSRLKGADKEHRYTLTALNFDRDTIIPKETADINQEAYQNLWNCFKNEFQKATEGTTYTSAHYQTIVALLHKYTVRVPSATAWGNRNKKTVPDISLYDHLRTTAAIAACIGHEIKDETEVDALLANPNDSDSKIIGALIKGDISGIQDFLYHILSDGASNQLRGRSFYLQLLTEAIAHWLLKQLDLPITNLILASGGHFYILAPYTAAKEKLDTFRKQISQKLWELHNGDIACFLGDIPIKAHDFTTDSFANKWDAVAEKINQRKKQKWAELDTNSMFQNLFTPNSGRTVDEQEADDEKRRDPWQFEKLGKDLRQATTLTASDIQETLIPDKPKWQDALKAFGLEIRIHQNADEKPNTPSTAEHTTVYRLGDTDFLSDIEKYQSENVHVSYDFRIFHPVTASKDDETIADYNALAEASEGVDWLGALRMDVDNLGSVFKDKLKDVTISRSANLSRELRLFFEGYVPQLCKEHNNKHRKKHKSEILELIYAGGDDLFLVGGWSALPKIAQKIRCEFYNFVTGKHITLSGGIAIEHMKFPLYQFADLSGKAETAAKNIDDEKNAITFLQQPMKWSEFAEVRKWHKMFIEALTGHGQLPRDILTRLPQIYSKNELEGHKWAWRSLYYFHRLQERYKYDEQKKFLHDLKQKLNHQDSSQFREELIHVITRWTALRIRN